MRTRLAWLIAFLALTLGGFATWSLLRGQAPTGLRLEPVAPNARPSPPADGTASVTPAAEKATPVRDPEKLSPLQRQVYLTGLRGADRLSPPNRDDGRFVYGYLPAVNTVMEGDHYLRQVGAAFALARAARFTGDERYTARATQAVLALLSDTVTDPKDPEVRHTALP